MDEGDSPDKTPSTSAERKRATDKYATGKKKPAEWFDIDEKHNTSVYVSGLPITLTEDDFIDLMKRYGIIARKPTHGNPYNIKLYKDPDGSFKGDALCRFIRVESVELAITYLEGYEYDEKHILHCERARFECKGSYDPKKKPKIDPRSKVKQKKAIEKLLSWEPKEAPEAVQKRVILKNMFSPEEILEDPSLIIEIKEDVESKCAEVVADPKKIEIFDRHPEGVIAVTFAEASHAQACIDALNNKFYAQRTVSAHLWDGKTRYKIQETDEESERRLEKWKQDIQNSDEPEEERDDVGTTGADTNVEKTSSCKPKESWYDAHKQAGANWVVL